MAECENCLARFASGNLSLTFAASCRERLPNLPRLFLFYSPSTMPLPSLRYLDISPVEQDGETMICLRDPEGFVPEPLVLSPAAFLVASYLNGENTIADIQYAFCNHTGGQTIRDTDIERIVEVSP